MGKDELVSIVVPVYNVEPYLRQCVESICQQTYDKIEIIMVDDGSTDKSGAICDEYVKRDERIKVYHQKNMGLSEARNVGLKYAKGSFLYFVDSDDWLDSKAIETLVCRQQLQQADVVCGSYNIADEKKVQTIDCGEKEYRRDEAVLELCRDQTIKNYACGKLYRRELFQDIRFPKGKLFEDIYTTFRIFMRAQLVVTNGYCGYYYRNRRGGISKQKDIPTAIARCEAQTERYGQLERYNTSVRDVLQKQVLSAYMALVMAYWGNCRRARQRCSEQLRECCLFWDAGIETGENALLSEVEQKEVECLKRKDDNMFSQLLFLNVKRKLQEKLGGQKK